MGAWSESLYGNDSAQDTLIAILEDEQQGLILEDILERVKTSARAEQDDTRLVIAELEYDFIGQTPYVEQALELIQQLKEPEELAVWERPAKRLKVLEDFEAKLNTPPTHLRPRSELREWLLAGRTMDIL